MSNQYDVLQVVLFNQLCYGVNLHMTVHLRMRHRITGSTRQIKRVGTMTSPFEFANHRSPTPRSMPRTVHENEYFAHEFNL